MFVGVYYQETDEPLALLTEGKRFIRQSSNIHSFSQGKPAYKYRLYIRTL